MRATRSSGAQPQTAAIDDPAPPQTAAIDDPGDVIRPRHLSRVTGLSATTVWRMRQRGEFPPPIEIGAQAVGWRRGDIDAWLASRRRRTA